MVNSMVKRNVSWFAAVALIMPLTVPLAVHSAELHIEFEEPERFSDIQAARESRARFQERTIEGFDEIFTELAQSLPDDQVLHVKVTNIDLAGYVDQIQRDGGLQPVRVVRQNDTPSMTFEYSLVDTDGNVLQEGEERLRGRGVAEQVRRVRSADQDHLRLEREMIERWFERTFDVQPG